VLPISGETSANAGRAMVPVISKESTIDDQIRHPRIFRHVRKINPSTRQ
jgi:hypothetical protein